MERSRYQRDNAARPSHQITQSELNPWKGGKIPEVLTNLLNKHRTRDFFRPPDRPHRPQRLNDLIRRFNDTLASITGQDSQEALEHLSPDQKGHFMDYITEITRECARYSQEAIKDYGKSTFSPSKGTQERQRAFERVEELNTILKDIRDNVDKAGQIWKAVKDIEKSNRFLPEDYRKKINSNLKKAINDIEDEYGKIFNKSSRKDDWERLKKPISWIESTYDYNKQIIRLNNMLASITGQDSQEALEHLSPDQKGPFMNYITEITRDLARYSPGVIKDYGETTFPHEKRRKRSIKRVVQIDTIIENIHHDLRKVEEIWGKLKHIREFSYIIPKSGDGEQIYEKLENNINHIKKECGDVLYYSTEDYSSTTNERSRKYAWEKLETPIKWIEKAYDYIEEKRKRIQKWQKSARDAFPPKESNIDTEQRSGQQRDASEQLINRSFDELHKTSAIQPEFGHENHHNTKVVYEILRIKKAIEVELEEMAENNIISGPRAKRVKEINRLINGLAKSILENEDKTYGIPKDILEEFREKFSETNS